MTSQEYFCLLPVFEALRDGKTIQYRANPNGCWEDFMDGDRINVEAYEYRVKPSPRIRPFKSGEECWAEMQKHQPFGWVQSASTGEMHLVTSVLEKHFVCADESHYYDPECYDFDFADGTPFGIKEGGEE